MNFAQYSPYVFRIVVLASNFANAIGNRVIFYPIQAFEKGVLIEFGIFVCVCSAFTEYLECSHRTVRSQCGDDTARFTKDFLDRMSSSLLKVSITSPFIIFPIRTKSMCRILTLIVSFVIILFAIIISHIYDAS